MITKIEIAHFKSINELKIVPQALNLLTGVNSSGKSTLLQAMLLMRQSYLHGDFTRPGKKGLLLDNGDTYVNLGTFKDVLSEQAKQDDKIRILVGENNQVAVFESEQYGSDNRDKTLIAGTFTSQGENHLIFSDTFQYLAAERIGPQDYYPRFTGENRELGKDGRYTPHFIEKYGSELLSIQALSHSSLGKEDFYPLIQQINAWMTEISPSIEIQAKENLASNRVELSYRYRTQEGIPTQDRKPQNVGFGITQILPLLIAILASKPGDLLLLENPETHLHPRAQSKIGQLMAIAAQHGVQIFVETHSDHILNGILVACRQRFITPENIKTLYFDRNPITLYSQITEVEISEGGRIRQAPKGFFDQYKIDIKSLI
jgi:predicted ATPase